MWLPGGSIWASNSPRRKATVSFGRLMSVEASKGSVSASFS